MKAIFKKEIAILFSTFIGYLIIALFLLVNSILLWTDISQFNIIDYGYADLSMFFFISPILLILFIPSISMRSFSEEYSNGTIEVLITSPINISRIIFAKFLAIITVVLISLVPTVFYIISVYYLGETIGNLDLAGIFGSYIGLILLSCLFTSISIFCSSLSINQITSFINSVILCCLFYYGFDILSHISFFNSIDLMIQKIGIAYHYEKMSKGLLVSSDILYFLSVSLLFLALTRNVILNKE